MMTRILLALVRAYQLALSPFLGRSCRFHPSCSHYAIEAIREHGPARGSMLAARRICRCHPWHPGGYDPVPPAGRGHPEAGAAGTDGTAGGNAAETRPDSKCEPKHPGDPYRHGQSGPARRCKDATKFSRFFPFS